MNKGRWAIVVIVLVALGMAISTWPLLKIRRRSEIYRTEGMLEELRGACEQYRAKHGRYPSSLADLGPTKGASRDAWGRPVLYEIRFANQHHPFLQIQSCGPDPADPSDDIFRYGPPVP